MTITLHDLQTRVDTWIRAHDDYWHDFQILAKYDARDAAAWRTQNQRDH